MKTKLPLTILALLLAARLGAADAPKPTPPAPVMSKGTVPILWSEPGNNGALETFYSTREPIVTRTADGWSITFAEPKAAQTDTPRAEDKRKFDEAHKPVAPILAPNPRLAPDGVNVITTYEDGTEISTAVFVKKSPTASPATTASTSRP